MQVVAGLADTLYPTIGKIQSDPVGGFFALRSRVPSWLSRRSIKAPVMGKGAC
jgi:hypothetical protein